MHYELAKAMNPPFVEILPRFSKAALVCSVLFSVSMDTFEEEQSHGVDKAQMLRIPIFNTRKE